MGTITIAGDPYAIQVRNTTWASKPTTGQIGQFIIVSDLGLSGVQFFWNGSKWARDTFYSALIAQCAIGICSSGTVGANGALTLTTALNNIYSVAQSNGIYLYFPAGAINSGSAAGVYYVIMSSTSAGIIYNNTYTGGQIAPPATPTPFSGTTGIAYTQTAASDITLVSLPLQAGLLGSKGKVKFITTFNSQAITSVKNFSAYLNASVINNGSQTLAAWTMQIEREFANMTPTRQTAANINFTSNYAASGPRFASIDTTVATTWSFTAQIATATDFIIFDDFTVQVTP